MPLPPIAQPIGQPQDEFDKSGYRALPEPQRGVVFHDKDGRKMFVDYSYNSAIEYRGEAITFRAGQDFVRVEGTNLENVFMLMCMRTLNEIKPVKRTDPNADLPHINEIIFASISPEED